MAAFAMPRLPPASATLSLRLPALIMRAGSVNDVTQSKPIHGVASRIHSDCLPAF